MEGWREGEVSRRLHAVAERRGGSFVWDNPPQSLTALAPPEKGLGHVFSLNLHRPVSSVAAAMKIVLSQQLSCRTSPISFPAPLPHK